MYVGRNVHVSVDRAKLQLTQQTRRWRKCHEKHGNDSREGLKKSTEDAETTPQEQGSVMKLVFESNEADRCVFDRLQLSSRRAPPVAVSSCSICRDAALRCCAERLSWNVADLRNTQEQGTVK